MAPAGMRSGWSRARVWGGLLVAPLCVSRSALAGSGDTCITKSLIAFPSGLIQHEAVNLAALDKDQDGLLDEAEDELAACVAPLYKFDSEENARFADEPVVLHRVFPRFFSPAGNLVVHVRFVGLYRFDGGFIHCSSPQAEWCNDHYGDMDTVDVQLEITGLHTARLYTANVPTADESGDPEFSGTSLIVYVSAGKHHHYNQPLFCPGETREACDCAGGCGLGHWDRAKGNGATVRYPGHNVGEPQSGWSSWAINHPTYTPLGFVNDVGGLFNPPMAGEYLYDPCGSGICDGSFQVFGNSDSEVSSVHAFAFGYNSDLRPLILKATSPSNCTYALKPQTLACGADDTDCDGIPDACDPCPRASRRGRPDGSDVLMGITDNGRDLLFADSDGDHVSDGCDLCQGQPDRQLGNSNEDGEADLRGSARAGDACDANAVASILSVQTPTAHEQFEDDQEHIHIRMRGTQALPNSPIYGGSLTAFRCFCVREDGTIETNLERCSNKFGGLSTACPRDGVRSNKYETGIGWLPFRNRRIQAPTEDACQPLAGSQGQPEVLCERDVELSYPSWGNEWGESKWQRRPTLEWTLWDETKESLKLINNVPKIPQAVRVANSSYASLWTPNFGAGGKGDGDLTTNALCALDPSLCQFSYPCTCATFDCYFTGGSCLSDALPFSVNGHVAFWSRVDPDHHAGALWDDHEDEASKHLHDSFSSVRPLVSSALRGSHIEGHDLRYKPAYWWEYHPNVLDDYSERFTSVLGGTPVIFQDPALGEPMSAVYQLARGEATRYGALGAALASYAGPFAFATSAVTPGASASSHVPEWLVWDGATGALLRLGTDGIDRSSPVAAIPEQYEVKSHVATGITGDQGVLVPLGATSFVLGVRSSTQAWSFSRVDETGTVTPLAIPATWSDEVRLVAVRDRVVLVGRIVNEQMEEPAIAIIDADGQVTARIEPAWPIRDGAWVGSVEGESTLLIGGGLDANGPHGDLVAIGLPLLDTTTILQDGEVDPMALGPHASLSGVREDGAISVLALRQGLAGDHAPPVMKLTADGWRASGLAALDAPFANATSIERMQLGEACAPAGASWFNPLGQLEWGTSPAEPLHCSAEPLGAASSTLVGSTTAFTVQDSSTWVANGGGLHRYQLLFGKARKREQVAFGANATALAASNHLLAAAVGSSVSVHRKTAAGWTELGTVATCDAVHTLAFDGGTLWAAGTTHLTRIPVGRSSLGAASSFVLGIDAVNNERLLGEASTCTSPTVEPLERMAVAGHTLVLGRAHSIQAYDLRQLPELIWIGTQPFTAPLLVEALRTDGARVYAKLSHPAAGPSYPVFRLGPSQAFVPTGSATAIAWIEGAEWGDAIAAQRSSTSVEIRTW